MLASNKIRFTVILVLLGVLVCGMISVKKSSSASTETSFTEQYVCGVYLIEKNENGDYILKIVTEDGERLETMLPENLDKEKLGLYQ